MKRYTPEQIVAKLPQADVELVVRGILYLIIGLRLFMNPSIASPKLSMPVKQVRCIGQREERMEVSGQ